MLIWVYWVSGAVFMLLGLLLLGWGRNFSGTAGVLLAASMLWIGESSYQEYKK